MLKERIYRGYNQVTANRIVKYLDKQGIKCSQRVFARAANVRLRVSIYVKKNVLSETDRFEIRRIIEELPQY